eukprot:TRINITY_DN4708_c0_g1_i1.p1 TRINITY_DN4708_c0_g1~~TRINITY_DN4708_c0_g1_i1.p1  ORF type:complete len:186 (+),score=54.89 TRINITY_DN4708_c0_g1_i1:61-558(+)
MCIRDRYMGKKADFFEMQSHRLMEQVESLVNERDEYYQRAMEYAVKVQMLEDALGRFQKSESHGKRTAMTISALTSNKSSYRAWTAGDDPEIVTFEEEINSRSFEKRSEQTPVYKNSKESQKQSKIMTQSALYLKKKVPIMLRTKIAESPRKKTFKPGKFQDVSQ